MITNHSVEVLKAVQEASPIVEYTFRKNPRWVVVLVVVGVMGLNKLGVA